MEVIVGVAVFTFAILATIISVLYFYRTNTYAVQQASAVSSAQHGIETMVKNMREASYASNGAYPIVSIGTNDLVFYSDIDTTPYVERVHYYLQGLLLMRGTIEPSGDPPVYSGTEITSQVSDYVHNINQSVATFQYFDKNGNAISDYTKVADVRFITMNIVVNVDPNRLPNQLTLHSTAALRNVVNH